MLRCRWRCMQQCDHCEKHRASVCSILKGAGSRGCDRFPLTSLLAQTRFLTAGGMRSLPGSAFVMRHKLAGYQSASALGDARRADLIAHALQLVRHLLANTSSRRIADQFRLRVKCSSDLSTATVFGLSNWGQKQGDLT